MRSYQHMFIVLACCMVGSLYSNHMLNTTYIKRYVSDAVSNDLVGNSCEFEFVDNFHDLVSYNQDKVAISIDYPTNREFKDYSRMEGLSLTKSNPPFGKGYVIGQPSAEIWAKENKVGWSIPPDHPRNSMKQFCVNYSQESGYNPVVSFPNMTASLVPYYIAKLKNVFIDDKGIAALNCGYYQGHQACETLFRFIGKKWYKNCVKDTKTPECKPSESARNEIQNIDTVFVITAQWDHNYHHYMIDSFMRLIRYYDFLQKNPDIKIHIRGFEKFAESGDLIFRRKEEREAKKDSFMELARIIRHRINSLMGFDDSRFVQGPIRAQVAYYPRSIKCSSPISHALEVRLLVSQMLKRSLAYDTSKFKSAVVG
jgi:hypothetical protein